MDGGANELQPIQSIKCLVRSQCVSALCVCVCCASVCIAAKVWIVCLKHHIDSDRYRQRERALHRNRFDWIQKVIRMRALCVRAYLWKFIQKLEIKWFTFSHSFVQTHKLAAVLLWNVYFHGSHAISLCRPRLQCILLLAEQNHDVSLVWFHSHPKSHICHLFALNTCGGDGVHQKCRRDRTKCNKYDHCVQTKWHFLLRKYTAADVVNSHTHTAHTVHNGYIFITSTYMCLGACVCLKWTFIR